MIKKVTTLFENGFNGVMKTDYAAVKVGKSNGALEPYDMLYGALASCLYATFLDILRKKRVGFKQCRVIIDGKKNNMHEVDIVFEVMNCSNEMAANKAIELATKYCSIFQMMDKVAKMNYKIDFV